MDRSGFTRTGILLRHAAVVVVVRARLVQTTGAEGLARESGTPHAKAEVVSGHMATTCEHVIGLKPVDPLTPQGCAECLASGDRWVHLRLCLTCGHVGCCDSSPNRHATAHYKETGHPVIRSFEPGEDWRWCYIDDMAV